MNRSLRRPGAVSLVLTFMAFGAGSARAQMVVYDPSAVTQLIQQAQTAVSQLEQLQQQLSQGERLFTSLNQLSNVNAIASELGAPALRAFLPDAQQYVAAAQGDLNALGQIGQQALAIRRANRLYTPAAGDVVGADLDAAGARSALDLAMGEAVVSTGASRLQGLQALQAALSATANPRAVFDLQARIGTEQAMIANDQMRLQGLAMTQNAETRVDSQRAAERAAAARSARIAIYKSGFQ